MKAPDHHRLWRLVEGAVVDALQAHPDYLTPKGGRSAVESITKRVVGQLVGHATEARKRGPLGASRAVPVASPDEGSASPPAGVAKAPTSPAHQKGGATL